VRNRVLLFVATIVAAIATRRGMPVEFALFAMTLVGIALFERYTLFYALAGLVAVSLYKVAFTGFKTGSGMIGLGLHLAREWVALANLLGLLLGFALLSAHFAASRAPALLPRFLPDDWRGGCALLAIVFVLSAFLDNIAAALIGATMASGLFRGRVHIGYLAAIVAAANAGGAGSVVGDTTTTMMWIHGVSPLTVLRAYVAGAVALVVFGIPASLQQQSHSPIVKDATASVAIDWVRGAIVLFVIVAAIGANVIANVRFPALLDRFPVIAIAIWLALIATAPLRRPDWAALRGAVSGTVFLLALVALASMMPVEELPPASWRVALGVGFVSAVFNNIPLTALALKQGGYDWGMLAYTIGFGGSIVWFGSSAGVAVANLFPEAKSVGAWLKGGWHVAVAYVAGFVVLFLTWGWRPD
jgi:Na+/H+ antiporter NhaD/arsenite permease-like protein